MHIVLSTPALQLGVPRNVHDLRQVPEGSISVNPCGKTCAMHMHLIARARERGIANSVKIRENSWLLATNGLTVGRASPGQCAAVAGRGQEVPYTARDAYTALQMYGKAVL